MSKLSKFTFMKKQNILVLLLISCLTVSSSLFAKSDLAIIPEPNSVTLQEGVFSLKKNTVINYKGENIKDIALVLQKELMLNSSNVKLLTSKYSKNSIILETKEGFPEEGYKIIVTPENIICQASTSTGLFYAVQSIAQLAEQGTSIPCTTIEDAPAYGWRGFMLDESRHFKGKEIVKQYLDVMARLKLNRFHWHLTDEDGWRIEIKKYPKLTTIGSIGNWSDRNAESRFYTQDEIKEIVAYAKERHIMVIPEIDMPGHATAATKAYPEISGGGVGRWEGFTFNPAKEVTYQFFNDVLDEVIALFPAPYIHIGADEVHFGNQSWYTDPMIQKFIRDNYLIDEIGLEHYFVRRICQMVNDKGKTMIGWDEIINTGVTPKNAVVMWWRHDKPALLTSALDKGFNVIMTPRIPCYFDFIQDDVQKIGRRWHEDGKYNTLETVYSFPQSIDKLIADKNKQIMGMQANVFSERILDKKRLDYMVFPRLLAMAEDAWTKGENKNYPEFLERVKLFMPYMDKLNIFYYNIFNPESTPEPWGPDKQDVVAEG